MTIFDQALIIALLAIALGCLLPAVRAAYRFYHWRRSLDRIEKTEWIRLVQALRTTGHEERL
ncbi:MAG: hypothetical protein ACK5AZ_02910 [Bryobacteraceae bacterium]